MDQRTPVDSTELASTNSSPVAVSGTAVTEESKPPSNVALPRDVPVTAKAIQRPSAERHTGSTHSLWLLSNDVVTGKSGGETVTDGAHTCAAAMKGNKYSKVLASRRRIVIFTSLSRKYHGTDTELTVQAAASSATHGVCGISAAPQAYSILCFTNTILIVDDAGRALGSGNIYTVAGVADEREACSGGFASYFAPPARGSSCAGAQNASILLRSWAVSS